MNAILSLAAIPIGLMIGSFLNVLIHRLPRSESIVRPRSYCPSCRRTIPWFENVPVASYLALRGRCSGCGARIPLRYPAVELIGGALAFATALRFGATLDALFVLAFVMALLAVTVIDWEHRIIPDSISLPFILAGLAWAFLSPGRSPVEAALGIVAGGGGLYAVGALYRVIRRCEGMGGGDVKLMAMIGAFLGVRFVLPVILIASFAGSLYGIALLRKGGGGKTAVAFGSFLAPAAAVCTFLGPELFRWYRARF